MNAMKSLIAASTITLVSLTSLPSAVSETNSVSLNETDQITANTSFQAGMNRVIFASEGEPMVGNLYLPTSYQAADKLPVVVVTGAWTTVKEQMPAVYAQRLAERGFAAFTFDFRYWGESGGTPRQYESPAAKVQDIQNAVAFLKTLPVIHGERIGGLGICASAGYMAQAVAEDDSFKSFATVAAWLHDIESLKSLFGESTVNRRMELGRAARRQYEQTGEVEYVPAYAQSDVDAAMSGDVSYYASRDRGVIAEWTNRFAVMSWHEWQEFDALAIAAQVTAPTLVIHSDGSALPDNARRFYASLGGEKHLVWTEGQHLDFYDRDPQVSAAVDALVAHFQATL